VAGIRDREVNKNAILVDSSVWIHYFRRSGRRQVKEALTEALAKGQVTMCWVVKAELLVGTADDARFRKLNSLLDALPDAPINSGVWQDAARLGADLRRGGVTVPLPDLVIAQAAMRAGIELWHADNHFEEIRKLAPLRTRDFSHSD